MGIMENTWRGRKLFSPNFLIKIGVGGEDGDQHGFCAIV
jgi:hypothetical protein